MRTEFRVFYQSRRSERWKDALRVPLTEKETAIDVADALGKALRTSVVVNEVVLDDAGGRIAIVSEKQIHEWRP